MGSNEKILQRALGFYFLHCWEKSIPRQDWEDLSQVCRDEWVKVAIADLKKEKTKHSHYYKDVSKLETVDVYRVLSLFEVTDPCLQHAAKKLLVAGGRGAGKDITQDIQEAIDSLERWKQMQTEGSPSLTIKVNY